MLNIFFVAGGFGLVIFLLDLAGQILLLYETVLEIMRILVFSPEAELFGSGVMAVL